LVKHVESVEDLLLELFEELSERSKFPRKSYRCSGFGAGALLRCAFLGLHVIVVVVEEVEGPGILNNRKDYDEDVIKMSFSGRCRSQLKGPSQ
jgi:hypothetical protein